MALPLTTSHSFSAAIPEPGEPATRTAAVTLSSGRRMTFDRHGESGPAVLLLHGIPGWRGTFAEVARRLGRRCRVFAPDLLGFGDSDDPPPRAHAAEQAEAVLELAGALGLERFHLAGFDFGGPTAVLAAGRAPGRVLSLTVAATNLFPDTPIPFPLGLAKVPVLGDLFFRVAFGRAGLSMMWRAAAADRAAFPFARYGAALRFPRGVSWTRRILLASLRDLPGLYGEVERTAQSLSVPSLVVWGGRDPFFPVQVGERTARALRARFTPLEGCGHFVPEERPAELAEGILDLVARGG